MSIHHVSIPGPVLAALQFRVLNNVSCSDVTGSIAGSLLTTSVTSITDAAEFRATQNVIHISGFDSGDAVCTYRFRRNAPLKPTLLDIHSLQDTHMLALFTLNYDDHATLSFEFGFFSLNRGAVTVVPCVVATIAGPVMPTMYSQATGKCAAEAKKAALLYLGNALDSFSVSSAELDAACRAFVARERNAFQIAHIGDGVGRIVFNERALAAPKSVADLIDLS